MLSLLRTCFHDMIIIVHCIHRPHYSGSRGVVCNQIKISQEAKQHKFSRKRKVEIRVKGRPQCIFIGRSFSLL